MSSFIPEPCRYYQEEIPESGDLVMFLPYELTEAGVKVKLPEYNNREAFMMFSECSRRRTRSVKQLICLNRLDIAQVIRVDDQKQYIDISKKHVTPVEKERTMERYQRTKKVNQIVHQLCRRLHSETTENPTPSVGTPSVDPSVGTPISIVQPLDVYQDFIWPNFKADQVYFFLEQIKAKDLEALARVPEKYQPFFSEAVQRLITRTKYSIQQKLKINCFSSHGINGIIKAAQAGKKAFTPSNAESSLRIQYYKNDNQLDAGYLLLVETHTPDQILEGVLPPVYQAIQETLLTFSERPDHNDVIFQVVGEPQVLESSG